MWKVNAIYKQVRKRLKFFYPNHNFVSSYEKVHETAQGEIVFLTSAYAVVGFIPSFNIFYKFQPIHISLNSARTFSRPRKRKFLYPTQNLEDPKLQNWSLI
ncbi:MAG: hypothetical protein B6D34_00125 [Candidatus Brocadia sp. UTAMX1]|nr:MAG: hypothetical protein B6D34_00125 [Candidatus Brocadia sp. UTAMX1]